MGEQGNAVRVVSTRFSSAFAFAGLYGYAWTDGLYPVKSAGTIVGVIAPRPPSVELTRACLSTA